MESQQVHRIQVRKYNNGVKFVGWARDVTHCASIACKRVNKAHKTKSTEIHSGLFSHQRSRLLLRLSPFDSMFVRCGHKTRNDLFLLFISKFNQPGSPSYRTRNIAVAPAFMPDFTVADLALNKSQCKCEELKSGTLWSTSNKSKVMIELDRLSKD